MIKHGCVKCGKEFSTKSNLNQHLKRKIPCDKTTNLDCKKCNKVFFSEFNLKRHLNRKTPCIPKNKEIDDKIKIIEAEVKKEITILEAKAKFSLEIEKEKTKRKELSSKSNTTSNNVINSNNITTNTSTINNIIINNFRDNTQNAREILGKLSLDDFRYLVDSNMGVKGTIENIFRHFYNNPNFPENRAISIPDISKKEFSIYLDDMWKKVQYDEIRRPIINQLIQTIDHILAYFCTAPDASGINHSTQLCLTHQDHYDDCDIYIKNPKNDKHIKQSLRSALVL